MNSLVNSEMFLVSVAVVLSEIFARRPDVVCVDESKIEVDVLIHRWKKPSVQRTKSTSHKVII